MAESLTTAADVSPAGDGFVLSTGVGMQFVDAAGHSIPVNVHLSSRRAVAADDSPLPGGGVFRPSEVAIFTGTASPDGVVSTVDGHGRMWALGHGAAGRTVVRSAMAGGPWESHDLGPAIGAQNVQGAGSTLLVPGRRTMYVSLDAGATWTLRPGPYPQGEGPGSFTVWPDGTIVTGDYRARSASPTTAPGPSEIPRMATTSAHGCWVTYSPEARRGPPRSRRIECIGDASLPLSYGDGSGTTRIVPGVDARSRLRDGAIGTRSGSGK